jgi:hypothetical protein
MDKSSVTERALAALQRADATLRRSQERDPEISARADTYMALAREAQAAKQPSAATVEWMLRDKLAKAERELRNARRKPRNMSRPNIRYREIELAAKEKDGGIVYR